MDAVAAVPLEIAVLVAGSAKTYPLPLFGEVTIGRAEENDICINDPSVSRRHAILHVGAALRIEDIGSANGIRITTHRASEGTSEIIERRLPPRESMAVAPGDGILMGATLLAIQYAHKTDPDHPPASTRVIRPGLEPIIADDAMRQLYGTVIRIAPSPINVLLLGETGVGKEVMAETIHRHSARARGPMVCLNCASLSESLLESELFGHEAGAFTGAARAKPGLLETAQGGTVFLDEVGELPVSLQVKLLRVLEERKVLRVGGLHPRAIDVRFISATNRNLELEVKNGAFRQDMFFRLKGISLTIPPLRERVAEIIPLAKTFLSRAAAQGRLRVEPRLSHIAMDELLAYPWPGNIRELRNVIERAVVLCGGGDITPVHLGISLPPISEPLDDPPSDRVTIPSFQVRSKMGEEERKRIVYALEQCAGNQTQAAELLGMSRRTLVSRLDLYGLSRPRKKRLT